jgi:lysophospholipase L1-like esterase
LANGKTAHLSVLNAGYAGNRLLHDAGGPNALARFDRDVLDLDGVKYMIVMEGVNDIGHSEELVGASDKVTADELIFALTQLVARARMHGIKVIGATLTPYAGSKYASPSGERMREQVNAWIRSGGVLDGFVDFDKATRDPLNPMQYLPAFDSGDHLHPSDAGHQAMADIIDLSQFN